MKVITDAICLIAALLAFTFQRADIAVRADYVEENSVF